jgi:uncharacterized protein YifE (UPF0438 family)
MPVFYAKTLLVSINFFCFTVFYSLTILRAIAPAALTQEVRKAMNTATTLVEFASRKRFYDDTNFPHGFARSGDFTREQADVLERFGVRLCELGEGAEAQSESERQFQAVVRGERMAQTAIEKAWQQYQRALQRRQDYYRAPGLAAASAGQATVTEDDDA